MLLYEKDWKKAVTSTLILMLSGLFGFLVLNSPFSRENILFPMLSGMFGLSTILLSVMEESHIPEQHETNLNVHPKGFLTAVFMGCLAGIVVGFMPAIGVSQAVLLIQQIGGIRETEMFLISLASVNMANEIFSLNSLYLLNNPRSGSSIAIQKILGEVDLECNMLLTSSILISTFLASCIVWSISDRIIKLLEKCK